MRGFAVVIIGLSCACGPKQPERAPHYEPVNSPEAKTPCPEKWRAAKQARELALEDARPQTTAQVATAVFLQASCEHEVFANAKIVAAAETELYAELKRVRAQYHNAKNLYQEAARYQDLPNAILAYAGLGTLHRDFASKLRALRVPQDIRDAAGRLSFQVEIGKLARNFDSEAAGSYKQAIAAALPALVEEDASVRRARDEACSGLGVLRVTKPVACGE